MDRWAEGDNYERFMGRWSRPVAHEFVRWVTAPHGLRWLDVGCGTGALLGTIVGAAEPRRVAGVDPSPGFIAAARARIGDGPDLRIADAQSLPFEDGAFDLAVSGLALNFVPDPEEALREMRRVTAPGGTVAAYVWDYADGMQMLRAFWDAAIDLDPDSARLDEGTRFPLCAPAPLRELFTGAGLGSVTTGAVEVPTAFADFDVYWSPFLGGQGPAPSYVATLDAARRQRLAERLRDTLAPDGGPISLIARAWTVRGVA